MSGAHQPATNRFSAADLTVLVLAGLIIVAFRLHAYPAPLESDECNYAYFAERLLEGDRLYVDLWDHQPPGIFAILAVPSAVFGSSPAVSRTLALGLVLLTMLGLFGIARRWFSRSAAWTAALLFAVASSDPGMAGEGCNREIHMNVLLVAAWWTLARQRARDRWGGLIRTPDAKSGGADPTRAPAPHLAWGVLTRSPTSPRLSRAPRQRTVDSRSVLAAGLLVGCASIIKTVAALHWLALVPAIAMMCAPTDGDGQRRRLKAVAVFAAGPAAIWLLTLVYFAAGGRAGKLIDAVFLYNLVYGHVDQVWGDRFVAFFDAPGVFQTAPGLWLAGALGLFAFPWRRDRVRSLLIAGFVIGSYLAVCVPGRFWPHYYLLMLPPCVLLAAGLVSRIESHHRTLSRATALVILVSLVATEVRGYLLVEPDCIGLSRYGDRMSWARDQARRVASVTEPADTIYVWSFDASFYYYSGRKCASRYTMYTALIDDHPSAQVRRRQLLEDLARNKPRLILIPFSRHPPFPELVRFFQDNKYVSVGRTKRMEILCDLERPIPHLDWTWKGD